MDYNMHMHLNRVKSPETMGPIQKNPTDRVCNSIGLVEMNENRHWWFPTSSLVLLYEHAFCPSLITVVFPLFVLS